MKRLIVLLPMVAALAGCAPHLYRPDGGRYFTGVDLTSGQVKYQLLLPTDVQCQDLRMRVVLGLMVTTKVSREEGAREATCEKIPTTQTLPVNMLIQLTKTKEVLTSRYLSMELCEKDKEGFQSIPEPKRAASVVRDCAVS